MPQLVETRTVHTIYLDLLDNTLTSVEVEDEVEIVVRSRVGNSLPKKLTRRDIAILMGDRMDR